MSRLSSRPQTNASVFRSTTDGAARACEGGGNEYVRQ